MSRIWPAARVRELVALGVHYIDRGVPNRRTRR